jgi:hypothetical protein
MAKRVFDLVLSAVGLVVLSPFLLAIAAWIKLDSPGPVFFRQERVGRLGQGFLIHKFRTMRHAPHEHGSQITVGADARITRVGHVLRRHKLDELPQLIDVLAGTMSLVGPRPEVPRYVALYPAALREKVLSVRRHHRPRLHRVPRRERPARARRGPGAHLHRAGHAGKVAQRGRVRRPHVRADRSAAHRADLAPPVAGLTLPAP